MNTTTFSTLMLLLSFRVDSSVIDNSLFTINEVSSGGTSCFHQQKKVEFIQPSNSLNIYLNNKPMSAKKRVRKTCNIAIPIQVKAGYKLKIIQADAFVHLELQEDEIVNISGELFGLGYKSVKVKHRETGLYNKDLKLNIIDGKSEDQWSGCGGSHLLRVNMGTNIKNKNSRKVSNRTVKNSFIDKLVLKFYEEKCNII
ncbi:MAG: DUF4360 domain-containing protein [Bacteriovoracaceae bacterium]|nr:DUF4360 domain-containing protein [Bacteriovoracaceae bacterium]